MKKITILLFSIFALIFASCSSQKFHTTRIDSKNFSDFKTYAWLTPIDSFSKDYYNNDIAKNKILTSANKELEARGMTFSKNNPDLLFRYIAIVNNKSRDLYNNQFYGGFGWGGPWGYYRPWGGFGMGYYYNNIPVGKERVRYGHIIIEAVDRKTDTVIWQARGTDQVNDPEDAINDIPKMIQGIMKEYPIKLKK